MSEVQRFWSHEASNIRCVREADFDRVTAERDGLQLALNTADQTIDDLQTAIGRRNQRVDELEGLLNTGLMAMKRIYQAGRDFIVGTGSDCDSVELMMENDPSAREIRAALNPTAEAASHDE